MNGRMTLAAVVLLIAGAGVVPQLTPEQAKLAGVYTARIEPASGAEVATLVLSGDGSAKVTRAREDGAGATTTAVGVWTEEAGVVHVVMSVPGDASSKTAAALEVQEGALVARDLDPSRWGPAPVTLRRAG